MVEEQELLNDISKFSWWHLLADGEGKRATLADALGLSDLIHSQWLEQGVVACSFHRTVLVHDIYQQLSDVVGTDDLVALLMKLPDACRCIHSLRALAESLQCSYLSVAGGIVTLDDVPEVVDGCMLVLRLGSPVVVSERVSQALLAYAWLEEFYVAGVDRASRVLGEMYPLLTPGSCIECGTLPERTTRFLGEVCEEDALSLCASELLQILPNVKSPLHIRLELLARHGLAGLPFLTWISELSLKGRAKVRASQAELLWGKIQSPELNECSSVNEETTGAKLPTQLPLKMGAVYGIVVSEALLSPIPSVEEYYSLSMHPELQVVSIAGKTCVGDYLGLRRVVANILAGSESARYAGVTVEALLLKRAWSKSKLRDLSFAGLSLDQALKEPLLGSAFDAWLDSELVERLELLAEVFITKNYGLLTPIAELSLVEAAELRFLDLLLSKNGGWFLCDEFVSEGLLAGQAVQSALFSDKLERFLQQPSGVMLCSKKKVDVSWVNIWYR